MAKHRCFGAAGDHVDVGVAPRDGYPCRVSSFGRQPVTARSSSSELPSERGLFDDDPVDARAEQALVPSSSSELVVAYRPPVPGRSLRTVGRFAVLLGGSAAIGVGVASGLVTLPAAAFCAVGLATGQVLAQTWRQNRLGQSVVGGITLGDLDKARAAAEKALAESPAGVMRTLAASNLASVLIQQDLVVDAAVVLDRHPPGFFHMPLTTVLWLNNRAFAHLAASLDDAAPAPAVDALADLEAVLADAGAEDADDSDSDSESESDALAAPTTAPTTALARREEPGAGAAVLLDEAEKRLHKATVRDLGGPHNARKLASALAGTRAIERIVAGDGKGALSALKRAGEQDDGPATPFRTAERELCRTEALRLVGRRDEATIVLESLIEQPMTPRQRRRSVALAARLGLG